VDILRVEVLCFVLVEKRVESFFGEDSSMECEW
jgi:hypothetical protein